MNKVFCFFSIACLFCFPVALVALDTDQTRSAVEAGDVSSLIPPPVSSSLADVALAASFVLGDTTSATGDSGLLEGDELVFLAVLQDGTRSRHYLFRTIWRGESERERSKSVKRHASTGHVFEYTSPLGLLEVSTLGPISAEEGRLGSPQTATAKVPTEFLRMGFHEAASFELEQRRQRAEDPSLPHLSFFTNRSNPVDKETVRRQAAEAEALSIDEPTLRMLAARGVATDAFIQILNEMPGLSEVMWEIARKPSRLSLLRGGIRTSDRRYGDIQAIDPEPWGLAPGTPCYSYPFILSINGNEAVRLVLLVTEPSGPIQQSAGVFALLAKPIETSDKSLLIHLIGVRRVKGPDAT